jgi:hypothetical protein
MDELEKGKDQNEMLQLIADRLEFFEKRLIYLNFESLHFSL